jgi:hypothetical protein
MSYTKEGIAKHAALVKKLEAQASEAKKTVKRVSYTLSAAAQQRLMGAAASKPKVDVFGRPLDAPVSPRVQRIRDLQAGRRVTPISRPVSRPASNWDAWEGNNQRDHRPVQAQPVKEETYEEMLEKMRGKMDRAAEILESK